MSAPGTAHPSSDEQGGVRAEIVARALALGFAAVGFAPARTGEFVRERLAEFVSNGRHGEMGWLAEGLARRACPSALWPEARTLVSLAMPYPGQDDLDTALAAREHGYVSVYARNRDYHDVMKGRLKEIAGLIHNRHGGGVKVFVDTAPLLEKPLAQEAGLGWQGKHTNLVSRRLGSWFFLGEILTDLDIPRDQAETDHCGACRRCLDVCPTDAFVAPYKLDARRCISYLTIEHKGPIAPEFRKAMGNRIYGCDDCLAVCPWNKFAQAAVDARLAARADLEAPDLQDLLALNDPSFRAFFKGSPIRRIGRDRFVRNVLIAAGNSGSARLLPAIREHLRDPSPLVRGMAVWALGELLGAEALSAAEQGLAAGETDPHVKEEWQRLMTPSRTVG